MWLGAVAGLVLLPHLSSAAPGVKPPPQEVTVKVLELKLPWQRWERAQFLWDHFANKPEEMKFSTYNGVEWMKNYEVFSKELVRKAAELKLDSESLRKALDRVLKHSHDRIAYLPVGAYQVTLGTRPVWVVTVKWEYPIKAEKAGLGHIRLFAYDQKTIRKLAYQTCK